MAHVIKQVPSIVRNVALVDPVAVGAHRATLCRSFLYEPDVGGEIGGEGGGVVGKIKGWLLHSDPRLVGVLMRNFIWFENVLWLDSELDAEAPPPAATEAVATTTTMTTAAATEAVATTTTMTTAAATATSTTISQASSPYSEDDAPTAAGGQVALFIGEADRYIDGLTIYEDAKAAIARREAEQQRGEGPGSGGKPWRRLSATLWKAQDHGEWLGKEEQRRAVIDVLMEK